jgi:hypothetical protein
MDNLTKLLADMDRIAALRQARALVGACDYCGETKRVTPGKARAWGSAQGDDELWLCPPCWAGDNDEM